MREKHNLGRYLSTSNRAKLARCNCQYTIDVVACAGPEVHVLHTKRFELHVHVRIPLVSANTRRHQHHWLQRERKHYYIVPESCATHCRNPLSKQVKVNVHRQSYNTCPSGWHVTLDRAWGRARLSPNYLLYHFCRVRPLTHVGTVENLGQGAALAGAVTAKQAIYKLSCIFNLQSAVHTATVTCRVHPRRLCLPFSVVPSLIPRPLSFYHLRVRTNVGVTTRVAAKRWFQTCLASSVISARPRRIVLPSLLVSVAFLFTSI